jgi:hypothetical protein
MAIQDDFSVDNSGNIRHVAGTTVYSALALHAWLQDLADNSGVSSDDQLSILSANPSKLDGPRDALVASRLNLINSYNIDDTAARFINFGSVKQNGGDVLYSGLKSIGAIVAGSPIYVVQNGSKLATYWADGHVQVMVKAKTAGALIDAGLVRVFSRKYGQTFSDFQVDLSAGGENVAALATAVDAAITLTSTQAQALSSKVAIAVGDVTRDLGNGNGGKLYKGTITLSGGCTVQEAYQYLQWLCSESSTGSVNSIPGWRYLALDASYTPNTAAPFGTYAGGKWFVAQGWYVSGVLASEVQSYQLTAHDGTTQSPPVVTGITVGNLQAGDRVLVARDSGNNDPVLTKRINTSQFTLAGAHGSAATSVVVNEAVSADTPATGVIRIKGVPFAYTAVSPSTKTFTLASALGQAFASGDPAFVPLLDKVATGATESVTFQFAATINAVVVVRQGGGSTPIQSFETPVEIGASVASLNVVRNSDV